MTNDTTEEFLQVAVPTLARLAVKSHIEIVETVRHYFSILLERFDFLRCILGHFLPQISQT